MNKEIFASYLEETADELRAFSSTREYIFDVCQSLLEATKEFQKEELEECRLKIVRLDEIKDE